MPETIVLDVPSLLTAAGVFVSLLSALYARWQAQTAHRNAVVAEAALAEARAQSLATKDAAAEAKRQNRIAIHSERLEIYKAFLEFRVQLVRDRLDIKPELAWEFYKRTAWAGLYFPPKIANPLSDLFNMALRFCDARASINPNEQPTGGGKPTIETEFSRLFIAVETLTGEIWDELRLVEG